jgi:hypothetical protein
MRGFLGSGCGGGAFVAGVGILAGLGVGAGALPDTKDINRSNKDMEASPPKDGLALQRQNGSAKSSQTGDRNPAGRT